MGIDQYSSDIYLNANINEIFSSIKQWLHANKFKIKKEINLKFINAHSGSYLGFSDRGTKRWLEININSASNGMHVSIFEKVASGGAMVGNLIKEEVLGLAGYLESQFSPQVRGAPQSTEASQSYVKEKVIKEKIKVTYDLPDSCPKCNANLKYEDVTWRASDKVECKYCNSLINLIEKEQTHRQNQEEITTKVVPQDSAVFESGFCFCTQCGFKNKGNARFCKKCGSKL